MKTEAVHIMQKVSQGPIAKNTALAVAQILLWGGSFFILSVLAEPIMQEMKWSHQMVYGVFSISLLIWGLLSSRIGKIINQSNKDFVLIYSGVTMALGLVMIGVAESFWLFVAGWMVIGASMAMGLYDALFAVLGKKYGKDAGQSIIQITLISGFAPTISWFLVSYVLNYFDWRTACFLYAFVLLVTIIPLHRFALEGSNKNSETAVETSPVETVSKGLFQSKIFRLVLAYFTIGAVLMTGIIVQLIDILLSQKMTLESAVGIAALLGPSQVGVRALDLIFPQKTAERSALISAIFIFVGLVLLLIIPHISVVGVVIFGLGNGMRSILKGTLPLSVFGQKGYAIILGKLAGLPLLAQAATPFIGGFMMHKFGASAFLGLLSLLALVNILIIIILQRKTKNGIN